MIKMKRIIILLIATIVLATFKGSAKNLERGYRGFVDINAEAYFKKKFLYGSHDIVHSVIGFTTTHGYQFNNHFFVGGGTGLVASTFNYDSFGLNIGLPIYAIGRFDWNISKVPLFADLKIGSFLIPDYYSPFMSTLYINPSIGYRCPLNRKIAMNIGAGISLHYLDNYNYFDERWELMPSVKLCIEF